MMLYVRSRSAVPYIFGCTLFGQDWSVIELGDDEAAIMQACVELEVLTSPPGPSLNPSGKVWTTLDPPRLIDE